MQELTLLTQKSIEEAIKALLPQEIQLTQEQSKTLFTPMLQSATNPKFGHYQVNNTMSTMKVIKALNITTVNQGQVSAKICECIMANKGDIIESATIANVFVNITLTDNFLIKRAVQKYLTSPSSLPLPPVYEKQSIAVDLSSPNVAKEMHVGHLRSTIIGDTICRLLEYLGMNVHRINHVGDWGTQFGMLIANLIDKQMTDTAHELPIADLVTFYKEAKGRFDNEPDFQERAHQEVIKLQSGGELELGLWKRLCEVSRKAFNEIYDILDVKIEEFGESFYNPMLKQTVEDLQKLGLVEESDGAQIIKIEGKDYPLIVRKRDGGYNYDTTDMAAIRYRCQQLKVSRIIYVVDMGQASHFEMIFDAAKRAGWSKNEHGDVLCEHVGFGVVLGPDGKKFKTREGKTEKLIDLLQEAQQKAAEVVKAGKENNYTEEEISGIAAAVGIGAVKYADLSSQRTKDYVFSYEKMLNFKGNTASYMLYSFARISSIVRNLPDGKGGKGLDRAVIYSEEYKSAIRVGTPEERQLLVTLLKMDDVIQQTVADLFPHHICDWMYQVSNQFTAFYEKCRVLENEVVDKSRLALCEITRQALRFCFNVLGIREVEKM